MEVYVFPLSNVLLYPSSSKPLHIVEPRYVKMVEDSIALDVPIAIGFVDEPKKEHRYHSGESLQFVRQVVGFGRPYVIEHRADGSLLIFLQGTGKARLGRVVKKDVPYIVCEAEKINENHVIEPTFVRDFSLVQKVMVSWMQNHISDMVARKQFLDHIRTPEDVIGTFASYLVADHDMQQLILESNDINEKIHLISGLISSGELV